MMTFEAALERASVAAWDRDRGNATWCGLYATEPTFTLLAFRRVPAEASGSMRDKLRERGLTIGSTYRTSGIVWAFASSGGSIWDQTGVRLAASDTRLSLPGDTVDRAAAIGVIGFIDARNPGRRGIQLELRDGSRATVVEELDLAAEADPTYGFDNILVDAGWVSLAGQELAGYLGVSYREEGFR